MEDFILMSGNHAIASHSPSPRTKCPLTSPKKPAGRRWSHPRGEVRPQGRLAPGSAIVVKRKSQRSALKLTAFEIEQMLQMVPASVRRTKGKL